MKRVKNKLRRCRPSFKISHAGHLLSTKGNSRAASILGTEGKVEKRKRLQRGCLNGSGKTFKLSVKQKRSLPPGLQKAIIAYHRKLGKKIIP